MAMAIRTQSPTSPHTAMVGALPFAPRKLGALPSLPVLSKRSFPRLIRSAWKQEVLWTTAPLSEVVPAAEQLYHVAVNVSGNPQLMRGFTKPGQFVQLRVGDNKPGFFAIASTPSLAAKGRFEFLVKRAEGTGAAALCDLSKGDIVELSQVLGSGFSTEKVCPAEEFPTVLIFATGSGISPIRSLLESGIEARRREDVRLYYGARNLSRMAYQEKFREWELSGVQVIPVLSQADDSWTGERGYVQAAFSRRKGLGKPSQTGAFLCGHKAMAEEVTSTLLAEGVPRDRVLLNF